MPRKTNAQLQTEIMELQKKFDDGYKEYEAAIKQAEAKDATIAALKTNKDIQDQKLRSSMQKISSLEAEVEGMKDISVDALQTITDQHTKIVQLEHILKQNMKPIG